MNKIDLYKIKYYPDRFYIRLDGFDTENLTSFITNLELGDQHAIFIHEYYHYLTNITTYPGIRQFQLNFCDRFRIVKRLIYRAKLNAFPINNNTISDCKEDIDYWGKVSRIINEDDIDYNLVTETENSQNKKFEIISVEQHNKVEQHVVQGVNRKGARIRINIEIGGLVNRHFFELTFGAIDEFLSSAIDECLFEFDIANVDPHILNQRPFYPYLFFEDLLKHYGIERPSSLEKILLAYFALNSPNPPIALITILEILQSGEYGNFQNDPEAFLLKHCTPYNIDGLLNMMDEFAKECTEHESIHMAQAMNYYYDRFYIARQLKQKDFFYFIRPFLVKHEDKTRFKQRFLLGLSRIIQVFTPPIILKEGVFRYLDKLTTIGEATTHIIASYEIFESLKTSQIAKRPQYLKEKYAFPDNDADCDDIEKFSLPPITGVWRIALNEMGLYRHYLAEKKDSSLNG